jgi:1,4-alpha-glucan branching enzyme
VSSSTTLGGREARRAAPAVLVSFLAACGADAAVTHGPIVTPDPSAPDGGAPSVTPPDASPPASASLGATVHPGGVTFRVWAPHAERAFVTGDFDGWNDGANELVKDATSGVFSGDVVGAKAGDAYAFALLHEGQWRRHADPRAREVQGSRGASVVVDPAAYAWKSGRFTPPAVAEQIVYELHVGAFNATVPGKPGTWASAIDKLDHLQKLGVNMLEVMPPAEFAGDFSWGYNPAFVYAPETAYGTPDDMRRFVDEAHLRGMGVIVDIVHNHWGPQDLPLRCFDDDCLGQQGIYFYTDARITTPWGPRPDFGRPAVRRYIVDDALAWLEEYRCDGLRWDSVSNIRGAFDGKDNPDGWTLLRSAMDEVHALPSDSPPGTRPRAPPLMVAEDLFTLDTITKPTSEGGAGFDAQWDAAFFHPVDDTCTAASDAARSMPSLAAAIAHAYNGKPLQRVVYSEDHDEVANGRARIPEMISPGNAGSLAARKISTLGAVTVMTSPGIPMLFMGQEFLQDGSFSEKSPLDWSRAATYAGILALYTNLVTLRRTTSGLRGDAVDVFHVNDGAKVIAWSRGDVVVVANWSGRAFPAYDVGLPTPGTWHVRFNSDDTRYGADFGGTPSADVASKTVARDGQAQSGSIALGAYSAVILTR